jgi:adenylylsulfate kinase
MAASRNLTWHQAAVSKKQRAALNKHKAALIWFTGLSGAGKSTIAQHLDARLFAAGIHSYVLDGDNVRHGLNADLGFSAADRRENIRRVGQVAKLFVDAGFIVSAAFISPFRGDRDIIRNLFGPDEFFEIQVKCSLEECQARDPKGLYQKALKGEISEFTGISSPYEPPLQPELVLDTNTLSVEPAVEKILKLLIAREIIPSRNF